MFGNPEQLTAPRETTREHRRGLAGLRGYKVTPLTAKPREMRHREPQEATNPRKAQEEAKSGLLRGSDGRPERPGGDLLPMYSRCRATSHSRNDHGSHRERRNRKGYILPETAKSGKMDFVSVYRATEPKQTPCEAFRRSRSRSDPTAWKLIKRSLLQKSTISGKTYKAETLRKSKDFTL